MALLDVQDLTVRYETRKGANHAVDGVSFTLERGQRLGLIGESGCGKSTTGRALLRVLPRNGKITSGKAWFEEQDLLALSERAMRSLRWRKLSMIPQSSMDSLDPVYRVGDQLDEVLIHRGGMSRAEAHERAVDLFGLVGLAPDRLDNFPHEFSGGMRQRAVIAMALALNPAFVIADEPVTALDVIVQHQVLETFRELQERLGISVIMITHDISVVAETCDEVIVMYAGKIVERASARNFFLSPLHPYSLGLQNAYPNLAKPKESLISIEGYPPDLTAPPAGCRFNTRCPFAIEPCFSQEPPLAEAESGRLVACHRWTEVDKFREQAKEAATWQSVV